MMIIGTWKNYTGYTYTSHLHLLWEVVFLLFSLSPPPEHFLVDWCLKWIVQVQSKNTKYAWLYSKANKLFSSYLAACKQFSIKALQWIFNLLMIELSMYIMLTCGHYTLSFLWCSESHNASSNLLQWTPHCISHVCVSLNKQHHLKYVH